MTLSAFKDFIVNGGMPKELVIFQYEDDTGCYIANQYVDEICDKNNLTKSYIDSLADLQDDTWNMIDRLSTLVTLNVLQVETFSEAYTDYYDFKQVIVICKKIDKKIAKDVKDFVIKFPAIYRAKNSKIEEQLKDTTWQVKAYMQKLCPELSNENIEKLYNATNGSMYKLENEICKLNLLDNIDKNQALLELMYDKNSDLYYTDFYRLISAIVTNDKVALAEYLRHRNSVYIDVEPIGIITCVIEKFKTMLYCLPKSYVSKENFNFGAPSVYYTKLEMQKFSPEVIKKEIEFLSDIDRRLKHGEIDLSKNDFIDYIICQILIRY